MARRGRLEDLLLEVGVIKERYIEEPRPNFDFTEGEQVRLTDLKAGDRVTFIDYKGRVVQIEVSSDYLKYPECSIVATSGTDAPALNHLLGREFALSLHHHVDERLVQVGLPRSAFDYDYVLCVPSNADQMEGRYSEINAGR